MIRTETNPILYCWELQSGEITQMLACISHGAESMQIVQTTMRRKHMHTYDLYVHHNQYISTSTLFRRRLGNNRITHCLSKSQDGGLSYINIYAYMYITLS